MKSVTIILPVYNVERYIQRCLTSIINQTFQDFELIIIDDCGNDNSIFLCKQELKNSNICSRIIHNAANRGVSESRNIGIANSTSEYVLFVDSDDWLDCSMVEKLYTSAKENACDIVACKTTIYWEDKDSFWEYANLSKGIYSSNNYLNLMFDGKTDFEVWAKLIKRSLFENVNFPQRVTFEDMLTMPYLIQSADRILQLEDPLYFYVKRYPNTSLTGAKPLNVKEFLFHLTILKKRFALQSQSRKLYSQKFIYKNLLVFTYSSIQYSQRYSETKNELLSIKSFINFRDIWFLKNILMIRHILYLLLIKTNTFIFYFGFKITARIKVT